MPCGRSAKMSPQNCSAMLSPCQVGSSAQRSRSDERLGVKGESERVTSDACSSVDDRGRESVGRGAKLLGISVRQMKRLRREMKSEVLRDCCMLTGVSSPGTRRFHREKVIKLT